MEEAESAGVFLTAFNIGFVLKNLDVSQLSRPARPNNKFERDGGGTDRIIFLH